MKKTLILCLILTALGTGCGAKDTAQASESKAETSESSSSATKHTVQKPEGDAPWIDAYFNVVKEQDPKAKELELIDIDFDGIPELFLIKSEEDFGGSLNIYQAYTYKDGAVSEISLPDQANWHRLGLYKNKDTGELVWLADSVSSLEKDHEECSTDIADFSDFTNVKKTPLLAWTEEQSKTSSGKAQTTYYKMPDKTEMTREQLNGAKKELTSKYQSQQAFYLSSFLFELRSYDPGTQNGALDKNLFSSLARLYDETLWENSENENDPNYLQVTSIRNAMTAGYGENADDFSVSIVDKSAKLYKNGKKNLFLLGLNQINLLKDPKMQKAVNEKIKSQALSSLVEGNYKGSFIVYQDPFVYKNFLSIRQEIRYTEKDTGISKKYYTAAAYNMETGEDAKLSDLVEFDDKLKDKIYAGDFSNTRFTHEECLEKGIYDKLWSLMKNPDLKDHFYLSDTECGFIIDIAPDDSFCFIMPVRELKDYMH